MGTRGLLGVILRNRQKKAAYNQYDSYPIGLGVELVRFIKSLSDAEIEKMVEQIEAIGQRSHPSAKTGPAPLHDRPLRLQDLSVNTKRTDNWYCPLRLTQGTAALPHILSGALSHQIDSTDFAEDRLYCEWVCWVDWVERTVTVKQGMDESDEEEVDGTRGFGELTVEWMQGLQPSYEE